MRPWPGLGAVCLSAAADAFVARIDPVRRPSGNIRPLGAPEHFLADKKNSNDDETDGGGEGEGIETKIDAFLDAPLFDPDAPSNENNWFANLVKDDYDSAEALYAGVVVMLGVIVSQELLRIVKYGGGQGSGTLF
ncbi:hypothetical protein ACHAWF_006005 [Thalassiosira exigua]